MQAVVHARRSWRQGKLMQWLTLLGLIVFLPAGCMLGPTDGTRVPSKNSPISFQGYLTEASAPVTVEAFNTLTNTWDTIGNATSSSTVGLTLVEAIDMYFWNAGDIVLPDAYWTAGKGGHYARVRSRTGSTQLLRLTANLDGCFDGGISYNRMDAEGCFSWRPAAYVYTSGYSIAPAACPEASGTKTHGHYLLHNMPTCAQDIVYDKLAQHIDRQVIDDHYEIHHHDAAETEAMGPLVAHGETFEMGGFFGGHKRYIRRMQHRVSVFDYSWMPNGLIPAWSSNTTIPVTYRTPVAAPGGAANNCDSRSAFCNGWLSDPVVDATPNQPKPAGLSPANVCSIATAAALHNATSGWHGDVHVAIGGAFGTFDSPANPLFFLWHNFVNDIWEDWKDCP
jgi:hypothetical protein